MYVYIYNGILFNHAKQGNMPFAMTWMELEGIMLSEISHIEKDKYYMISLTCKLKKYDKTENIIKKKQTHRYRK